MTFHDEPCPTDMPFHLNPGPVALADAIEKKVKEAGWWAQPSTRAEEVSERT